MSAFFADTFYWIALIQRKDSSRKAVLEWSVGAGQKALTTTEEALTEVLVFFSSDALLRAQAARVVRSVLAAHSVRVIPQSHESFMDGLALYEARPDKGYSLTDCISMLIMRKQKSPAC